MCECVVHETRRSANAANYNGERWMINGCIHIHIYMRMCVCVYVNQQRNERAERRTHNPSGTNVTLELIFVVTPSMRTAVASSEQRHQQRRQRRQRRQQQQKSFDQSQLLLLLLALPSSSQATSFFHTYTHMHSRMPRESVLS